MESRDRTRFPGFPPGAFRFLRSLKRHNNREWFLANKQIYLDTIREPLEHLIGALAIEFDRFAPGTAVSPKASMYRINRDTRFSRDKHPYKTHVAAVFPRKELGKHEGAGFYFHFSPDELLIGGGLYMPLPEDLMALRQHIAAEYRRLDSIVKTRSFRRLFGELSGAQLSRVPKGFSKDHPAEFYLRYKQLLAGRTLPPETVTTAGFPKILVETFRALDPLVRFINEPIVRNRKLKQRHDALLQ